MTPHSTELIMQVVAQLRHLNIEIAYAGRSGWHFLGDELLLHLLEQGEAALEATCAGVSLEHYKDWLLFMDDFGQCRGVNRRGERCHAGGAYCEGPRQFVPGVTDYCHWHRP
ncbi:MAG TPA: hypothetical protein VJA25_09025 [Dehalococcoidia bacterium]|nr:hypothetical protein [Dehalococcoidia bacterium]